MVAQAGGSVCTADRVKTVLDQYENLDWDKCILLTGDGEARIYDTNGALWSDDRHGRWFETRAKPLVWLHIRIGQLVYGVRAHGQIVSHICGSCECIRAEHLVYQSVREDRLDRAHHMAVGRGKFRSVHVPKQLAISSPASPVSVIGPDRV